MLQKLAKKYGRGLRKLSFVALTDRTIRELPAVVKCLRSHMEIDRQCYSIRHRANSIADFQKQLSHLVVLLNQQIEIASKQKAAFDNFAQPVGEAAYQAVCAGAKLPCSKVAEEWKTLYEQLNTTRKQKAEIDGSQPKGFFSKAATFFQSFSVSVKLQSLENRIASANVALGKQLLDNNVESQISTETTRDLLNRVDDTRKSSLAAREAVTSVLRELNERWALAVTSLVLNADAKLNGELGDPMLFLERMHSPAKRAIRKEMEVLSMENHTCRLSLVKLEFKKLCHRYVLADSLLRRFRFTSAYDSSNVPPQSDETEYDFASLIFHLNELWAIQIYLAGKPCFSLPDETDADSWKESLDALIEDRKNQVTFLRQTEVDGQGREVVERSLAELKSFADDKDALILPPASPTDLSENLPTIEELNPCLEVLRPLIENCIGNIEIENPDGKRRVVISWRTPEETVAWLQSQMAEGNKRSVGSLFPLVSILDTTSDNGHQVKYTLTVWSRNDAVTAQ